MGEQEQGLLQLLVEMDKPNEDKLVLVIGATNLANLLDRALIRRFDRIINLSNPTVRNRLAVLKVHSKSKKFANPNHVDTILKKVAKITLGYSGAEMANLLNEASILSVREGITGIDLPVILEATNKVKLGIKGKIFGQNDGKQRFVYTQAAKVVSMLITPGLPLIESLSVYPRGGNMSRISTRPIEHPSRFIKLLTQSTNAWVYPREGTSFTKVELFQRLLIPFYASRAFEDVRYGPGGITTGSAYDLKNGAEIAFHLIHSTYQHYLRSEALNPNLEPTIQHIVSDLIEVCYLEARRLVIQRMKVIDKVAFQLLLAPGKEMSGEFIKELCQKEPLSDIDPQLELILEKKREKFFKNLLSQDTYEKNEAFNSVVSAALSILCEDKALINTKSEHFFFRRRENSFVNFLEFKDKIKKF